jgi:hypothetical protein
MIKKSVRFLLQIAVIFQPAGYVLYFGVLYSAWKARSLAFSKSIESEFNNFIEDYGK